MKSWHKTLMQCLAPAVVVVLALNVTQPKSADAAPIAPTVTAFTYTTPSGMKMESVSWFSDNIKCTMTRPYTNWSAELPVSLSCVKL